ncbi:hypothetical protein SASPL_157604 [Salvia splendens]|uniref:Uncharacterized protein n=1 Tax=Salvia splendens TaxID=180675 RepID=A0A8X8VUM5_SALSN|nr:hypothetical protein SASPL_157604 [Salvia splendens]
MAECRHGGKRGDARGGGSGGGRGDLQNEEATRKCDLRDIEIDDLRQQVRDLQRDIEIDDLQRQVRDLQQWEEHRQKSKPKRSNVSEHRLMHDPVFDDVCRSQPKSSSNFGGFNKQSAFDHDSILTSSNTDEPSKNCNSNILSTPVYDTPIYDEDMLSMPVYDEPVYDEDILSMPMALPLMIDDEELEGIVVPQQRKGEESEVFYFSEDVSFQKSMKLKRVGVLVGKRILYFCGLRKAGQRIWITNVGSLAVEVDPIKQEDKQLWPPFHYMLPFSANHGDRFVRSQWEAYILVYNMFYQRVTEVLNPEDENFELKHDKEGYGLSWSSFKEGYQLSGSSDCKTCLCDVSAKPQ